MPVSLQRLFPAAVLCAIAIPVMIALMPGCEATRSDADLADVTPGPHSQPPTVLTPRGDTEPFTISDEVTRVVDAPPEPLVVGIPGTTQQIEFVEIPGLSDDGDYYISQHEITWDEFDVFVYGLDEDATPDNADAVTRPSKPYISMDRGFGHAGYPAISMSYKSAAQFCEWLSAKTGQSFRLPTEQEWLHIARNSQVKASNLDDHAWYADNADAKTHPVGTKAPDALGLFDIYGNAAEWVTREDGKPLVVGGSYRQNVDQITEPMEPTPKWNESDPQFPKSEWWLADAGFIGFRIVMESKQAKQAIHPRDWSRKKR